MTMTDSPFIWERLRHRDEDLGYVGVFEKPDTELMKMLIESYTDEPKVVEVSDRLARKRQVVMENDGQQYQEYAQKEIPKPLVPDAYRGSTKIGRAYTNSLFQRLHAPILNTIYKQTHVGLDIKSSFSTMLLNAFRDLNLPFFVEYVNSPGTIYEEFREMGMGRSDVKKLVNGTICSWPVGFDDRPDILTRRLHEDVEKMAAAMKERYPHFVEMIQRKCEADGKTDHIDGTALFFLASDMEHSVMRAVMKKIFDGKNNLSDVVWKYDGIIVPMAKLARRRDDEVLAELKAEVKEKLDIDVAFKVDNLSTNSFGICINPDDRNRDDGGDAYDRWKACFERTWAVLLNPPVFMFFYRGGTVWSDMNRMGFDHANSTEPKEFIKRWHEDPNKRMYKGRDFVPPPLTSSEGYLNTYRGISAEKLPEVGEGVGIERYLRHVDILVGNLKGEHPEYSEYLHNLLAYKFQYPGLKWRVMPIILSSQGVGKDLWFDFISNLFGDYNCVKGNGISDFVEKKSGKLEGKLLCCFQEMGTRKVDKECEEQLKTYITNRHLVTERKHVNEVIVTNVVDFIGFSNKPDAVMVSADDRRFFIVTADSTYMQDTDYMYPLIAFFNDDEKKRAVYDFYMARDVDGFDPSRARPVTEIQKEMIKEQVSHAELFLNTMLDTWLAGVNHQDMRVTYNKRDYVMEHGDILRVSAKMVGEAWMQYAEINKFKNFENKKSMEAFFNKMVREMALRSDKFKSENVDKLVNKAKVGGGNHHYYLDVQGIRRYLKSILNEGEDEEEEEEDEEEDRRQETPPHKKRRGQRRAINGIPNPYLYKVVEDGEVVFESDDLEEINRELGEAYIDARRSPPVLIHQFRNNMEIDISEQFVGDHKYQKVEMKFPFYIRDRTNST